MKKIIIAIFVINLLSIKLSYGQDFDYRSWNTFECNYDCNSNLKFKIKYPPDWIMEEPDHYGLLKKFRPKNISGVMFSVSVIDNKTKIDDEFIQEFISNDFQYDNLENQLKKQTSNYYIYNIANVYIEANYGFIRNYLVEIPKIKKTETHFCRDYVFIYDRYIVVMDGTIIIDGILKDSKDFLEIALENYDNTFNRIAQSLVIKRE